MGVRPTTPVRKALRCVHAQMTACTNIKLYKLYAKPRSLVAFFGLAQKTNVYLTLPKQNKMVLLCLWLPLNPGPISFCLIVSLKLMNRYCLIQQQQQKKKRRTQRHMAIFRQYFRTNTYISVSVLNLAILCIGREQIPPCSMFSCNRITRWGGGVDCSGENGYAKHVL